MHVRFSSRLASYLRHKTPGAASIALTTHPHACRRDTATDGVGSATSSTLVHKLAGEAFAEAPAFQRLPQRPRGPASSLLSFTTKVTWSPGRQHRRHFVLSGPKPLLLSPIRPTLRKSSKKWEAEARKSKLGVFLKLSSASRGNGKTSNCAASIKGGKQMCLGRRWPTKVP